MKILVSYENQPILDIQDGFGLNRDRQPDTDWGELRNTNLESNSISEVELTENLKIILLEDLAYTYGRNTFKFNEKLKEFKII